MLCSGKIMIKSLQIVSIFFGTLHLTITSSCWQPKKLSSIWIFVIWMCCFCAVVHVKIAFYYCSYFRVSPQIITSARTTSMTVKRKTLWMKMIARHFLTAWPRGRSRKRTADWGGLKKQGQWEFVGERATKVGIRVVS